MGSKRRENDIMKLMMSDYKVIMEDDGSSFAVEFRGPKDTLYEGGLWTVNVMLPKDYPYRSPSIGFRNKIYHPNVDIYSGSVCLDVINQTWSPMYELKNVFDVFLPQLLAYPNSNDPLNGDAAALAREDPEKYQITVKEYVKLYASMDKARTSSNDTYSSLSTSCSSDTYVSTLRGTISSDTYCESTQLDEDDDDGGASLSGASDNGEDDDLVLDL